MHGKTPSDIPADGNGGQRRLYDSIEARAQLGRISESTFRRLTASGELEVVRIGSRVYVPADALDAYVDQLRAAAAS